MSHKNQRQVRILCFQSAVYSSNIPQHRLSAPSISISQILHSFYTFAMSSVVMDHYKITKPCQIFHKRKISLFMLTHAMNKLYYCSIWFLVRNHSCRGNTQPICFRQKSSFIPHNPTPLHKIICLHTARFTFCNYWLP